MKEDLRRSHEGRTRRDRWRGQGGRVEERKEKEGGICMRGQGVN